MPITYGLMDIYVVRTLDHSIKFMVLHNPETGYINLRADGKKQLYKFES